MESRRGLTLAVDVAAYVEEIAVAREDKDATRRRQRIATARLGVLQDTLELRLAEQAYADLELAADGSRESGARRRWGRRHKPLRNADAPAIRQHIIDLREKLSAKRERVAALERDLSTLEERPSSTTIYRLHSETQFVTLSEQEYAQLATRQRTTPQRLSEVAGIAWWWFADRFWLEQERLKASEIRDIVLERDRVVLHETDSSRRTLAITARELPPAVADTETPIPEIVRRAVWRRDQGRCVACGADHDLVFDVIVPVARGGSINPPNIELRCTSCR